MVAAGCLPHDRTLASSVCGDLNFCYSFSFKHYLCFGSLVLELRLAAGGKTTGIFGNYAIEVDRLLGDCTERCDEKNTGHGLIAPDQDD